MFEGGTNFGYWNGMTMLSQCTCSHICDNIC